MVIQWALSVGSNNPDNIVNYAFTVGSVSDQTYTTVPVFDPGIIASIFHGTEGGDEVFNRAQQFRMTDHKVDRRGFILRDDRPIALMNEYLDISESMGAAEFDSIVGMGGRIAFCLPLVFQIVLIGTANISLKEDTRQRQEHGVLRHCQ